MIARGRHRLTRGIWKSDIANDHPVGWLSAGYRFPREQLVAVIEIREGNSKLEVRDRV
jgi:hypothetical protein